MQDATYFLKVDGDWYPFAFHSDLENWVAEHLGLATEQAIFTWVSKEGVTYYYADKFVAADNRRDRGNDLQSVTFADGQMPESEPMRMPPSEPILPINRPIRDGGSGDRKSALKLPEKQEQKFAAMLGR